MKIEELKEVVDSRNVGKTNIEEIKLLLDAITDWPKSVTTLFDFLTEIKEDLKVESITYTAIDDKLTTLNPALDAWKIESLTAIAELIKMSDFNTLDEIVAYYQDMKYAPK